MKPLLIITFALLTTFSYAQQSTAAFKRLYVGVSTTQGVGYRMLLYNGTTYKRELGFERKISDRNRLETPSYSTNTGFRIGVKATKFLSFETGIEYSKKGYQAMQNQYNDYPSFSHPFDYTIKKPDNGYKIKLVYHYLDIPFGVNFSIGNAKTKALISTGVYLNIQLDKTVITTYSESGEPKKITGQGAKFDTRYNLAPFIGIGINHQINTNLSLNFIPLVQFQTMNNISDDYSTKEYLYSGGINMALNFGFIDVTTKTKK